MIGKIILSVVCLQFQFVSASIAGCNPVGSKKGLCEMSIFEFYFSTTYNMSRCECMVLRNETNISVNGT
jgi:hypothetical protein